MTEKLKVWSNSSNININIRYNEYYNNYICFTRKTEYKWKMYLKTCTNDAIKIILYVIIMTTLFMLYCSNKNHEIENSIDYYHSYNNKVIVLSSKNGT